MQVPGTAHPGFFHGQFTAALTCILPAHLLHMDMQPHGWQCALRGLIKCRFGACRTEYVQRRRHLWQR